MEFTDAEQLRQLFLSCGLGFLLGAYYDVFRVLRLILKKGKLSYFVQDILFFVTAAVVTFLFSLAVMNGQLRFYLFLGEIVGFTAYYFTVGVVVMRFAGTVIRWFLRIWRMIWMIVFYPFQWLFRLLKHPFSKIQGFFQKIFAKLVGNFKKGLKRIGRVLYNHKKASKLLPYTEGEVDDYEGR